MEFCKIGSIKVCEECDTEIDNDLGFCPAHPNSDVEAINIFSFNTKSDTKEYREKGENDA